MGALRGWHIVVLLVVVLLLFGAPKLPELARSIGKSLHILKDEAKSLTSDDEGKPTVKDVNDSANTSPTEVNRDNEARDK